MRLDLASLLQPKPRDTLRFRLLTLHARWGWHARLYVDGRLVARVTLDNDDPVRFEPIQPIHPTIARLAALPITARDDLLRQVVASDIP